LRLSVQTVARAVIDVAVFRLGEGRGGVDGFHLGVGEEVEMIDYFSSSNRLIITSGFSMKPRAEVAGMPIKSMYLHISE